MCPAKHPPPGGTRHSRPRVTQSHPRSRYQSHVPGHGAHAPIGPMATTPRGTDESHITKCMKSMMAQ